MRAARIGRRSAYGGGGSRLKLQVLGGFALVLVLVIAKPSETANAVAFMAHQLTVFVQSF